MEDVQDVQQPDEVTENTEEVVEETAAEKKARGMGWVPKEEWRGNPDTWRPAEEFVERGENIIPILKDRVNKLEESLEVQARANKAAIERVRKETLAQAERDYQREIQALREAQRNAVEEGDTEKFDKIQGQIDTLPPPQIPEPQENTVFDDWVKKNKWYGKNRAATFFANGALNEIAAEREAQGQPPLTQEQMYAEIEKQTRENFPDVFKNPNREKQQMVDTSTASPKKGGKKSFADLPQSAKDAYYRTKKRIEAVGGEFKKEDYVNSYDWS